MPSLNLHSLLDTKVEGRDSFLGNITLPPDDRKLMLNARTAVREKLRNELPIRLKKKAKAAGREDFSVPAPTSPRIQ